ncbi:MAG: hypothetical protein M0R06_09030, partial [Sphaerochaeta sp.]|nr:hypothetical protein [Sphaerochaeta sp.]
MSDKLIAEMVKKIADVERELRWLRGGAAARNAMLQTDRAGWINIIGLTPAYASATTITIPGDCSGFISKGDRLRIAQTTVRYFCVIGVSYSAPNT